MMKWSLLVVSFDRICAVNYPFRYSKYFTRKNVIILIIILWVVTVAIDNIPFAHGWNLQRNCFYNPHHHWSVFVIVVYNILPFCIILFNYIVIWRVAVRASLKDKLLTKAVLRHSLIISTSAVMSDVDDDDEINDYERKLSKKTIIRLKQPRRNHNCRLASNLKHLLEIKATKTSFVLIVAYICCWGPLGIFYTVDQFCDKCLSRGDHYRQTRIIVKSLNVLSVYSYRLCTAGLIEVTNKLQQGLLGRN